MKYKWLHELAALDQKVTHADAKVLADAEATALETLQAQAIAMARAYSANPPDGELLKSYDATAADKLLEYGRAWLRANDLEALPVVHRGQVPKEKSSSDPEGALLDLAWEMQKDRKK